MLADLVLISSLSMSSYERGVACLGSEAGSCNERAAYQGFSGSKRQLSNSSVGQAKNDSLELDCHLPMA